MISTSIPEIPWLIIDADALTSMLGNPDGWDGPWRKFPVEHNPLNYLVKIRKGLKRKFDHLYSNEVADLALKAQPVPTAFPGTEPYFNEKKEMFST